MFELFAEMKQAGVIPNSITYLALMNGLARKGDPNRLLFVFEQMKKDGIKPQTEHQVSLYSYYLLTSFL
jgi:pentatricopeptide repeat protein